MTYAVKPLSCDPARIKGMSEKLILSHYENNYGGAVNRLNLIEEQLAGLDFAKAPGFRFSISTSARAIKSRRMARPSSVSRWSVRLRLSELLNAKK